MRGKIFVISILLASCFILAGCSNNSIEIGDKSEYTLNNKLIDLQIKESTLTKTSATLILKNNTNDNYVCGTSYSIAYEKNGVWYEIKPDNEMNFNMIGYILEANKSQEIAINWQNDYGELSDGKYRIINTASIELEESEEPVDMKDFKPSEVIYIGVEFTIK